MATDKHDLMFSSSDFILIHFALDVQSRPTRKDKASFMRFNCIVDLFFFLPPVCQIIFLIVLSRLPIERRQIENNLCEENDVCDERDIRENHLLILLRSERALVQLTARSNWSGWTAVKQNQVH